MLEREMEDLIATNPDHFFPRYGFVLQGRQQSFKGIGRFDLLFTDRHGMTVLMELKAVPARYETIDQVARYRDALVALGSTNVIMWIVAPSIPPAIRDFLSHLGVEYTEIHDAEFARVAAATGYMMRHLSTSAAQRSADERVAGSALKVVEQAPSVRTQATPVLLEIGTDQWGFGNGTQPSFLIRALEGGNKTKEQIRSEYIAHFHPDIPYSEARSISGFNVFFSDSKRPVGTYHASRSLLIKEDGGGHLSLDGERSKLVKRAIAGGILQKLRGLHFKRDKDRFNQVLVDFGIPCEP